MFRETIEFCPPLIVVVNFLWIIPVRRFLPPWTESDLDLLTNQ